MIRLRDVPKRLAFLHQVHVARDPFARELARWFAEKGDQTLRLTYPLDEKCVVFDLGGYQGDFASTIHDRYGCKVYIFEPMPEYYQKCVDRFRGNESIICLNYGLSNMDGSFDLCVNNDASSFKAMADGSRVVPAEIRSITETIENLGVEYIDLMKVNIEGGEFDILPALIHSGHIRRIRFLQVQFHNFVNRALERRHLIRERLQSTHCEMWNYDFVWESWEQRSKPDLTT